MFVYLFLTIYKAVKYLEGEQKWAGLLNSFVGGRRFVLIWKYLKQFYVRINNLYKIDK